jgi:hypothetical protein
VSQKEILRTCVVFPIKITITSSTESKCFVIGDGGAAARPRRTTVVYWSDAGTAVSSSSHEERTLGDCINSQLHISRLPGAW